MAIPEQKNQEKYQESIEEELGASKESFQPEKEMPLSKEEEVLELERKLVEKKAELAKERKVETEPFKEREPVKETERAMEEVVPPPASPSAKVQQQVKSLKQVDRANQIKVLSELAFQKGLDFAIEVAKGLDNAYVLDEFHDTLVDELYQRLIEQGKLKKL